MTYQTVNPSEILNDLAELLDIPRSYYEKAIARDRSIGEWFCRTESTIAKFDPSVYAQGSFMFGTVIRPLIPGEEYDLDIVCELALLTKLAVTQKRLKEMVGYELRLYADAKGFKEPLVERKRCWRLDYADEAQFHVDTLPCVPEDPATIATLAALGVEPNLAGLAIALTCKSHKHYEILSSQWPTSNPAGFARWFEGRMSVIASKRRAQLLKEGAYASIQAVPTYALRTPLQRCIQLLKRHRDVMFLEDPEIKPISMIITTLAARAYVGEEDLHDAMCGILKRMPNFVAPARPRVENPVNKGEDFADKWAADPRLETNFWRWHAQAAADFDSLANEYDAARLRKLAEAKLSLAGTEQRARELTGSYGSAVIPSVASLPNIIVNSGPKPWSNIE